MPEIPSSIKDIAGRIGTGLKDAYRNNIDRFEKHGRHVPAAIGKAIIAVDNAAAKKTESIARPIVQAAKEAPALVKQADDKVANIMETSVKRVVQSVKDAPANITILDDKMANAVEAVVKPIVQIAKDIPTKIKDADEKAAGATASIVKPVITTIKNTDNSLAQTAETVAKPLVQTAKKAPAAIQQADNKVAEIVDNLAKPTIKVIKEIPTNVKKTDDDVAARVESVVKPVIKLVKEAPEKIDQAGNEIAGKWMGPDFYFVMESNVPPQNGESPFEPLPRDHILDKMRSANISDPENEPSYRFRAFELNMPSPDTATESQVKEFERFVENTNGVEVMIRPQPANWTNDSIRKWMIENITKKTGTQSPEQLAEEIAFRVIYNTKLALGEETPEIPGGIRLISSENIESIKSNDPILNQFIQINERIQARKSDANEFIKANNVSLENRQMFEAIIQLNHLLNSFPPDRVLGHESLPYLLKNLNIANIHPTAIVDIKTALDQTNDKVTANGLLQQLNDYNDILSGHTVNGQHLAGLYELNGNKRNLLEKYLQDKGQPIDSTHLLQAEADLAQKESRLRTQSQGAEILQRQLQQYTTIDVSRLSERLNALVMLGNNSQQAALVLRDIQAMLPPENLDTITQTIVENENKRRANPLQRAIPGLPQSDRIELNRDQIQQISGILLGTRRDGVRGKLA